ncbi:bifunctional tetrahydrofolate synthase/dihydrofolate synthase [Halomonas sp. TRM85114]|uniref:bifunctional tetrahydrofolate synthase/dihydrofolate synthase n=1 Tax=Halomonas jincaotanensis TaxID=2810616 RepID=UPI001BD318C9|nr:bifunctional tetrahydrofolate synthase/dihydrofolate synthase [Halomonas jincaotanensis]MBS9404222.1 bifunctional tetrahydrofolate synthase/dihydrofolate synthase [Halomonas jincaotanensis]
MHTVASSTALDAWLERLEVAHPMGIDLGLERVARVARRMGLLDTPVAGRLITVAGTNGKGSTVAMLDALAQAHGRSTAAYTSPHLLRYNERLRLSGAEASDSLLIDGFATVERARIDGPPISLSYFEVGTLGALWAIARQRPDLAILEVGLGGRLDAVNIVDPDVAVVTTVAQDHAAYLGNDIEGIGREKAGIMRSGRPVVLGSTTLPESVREVAAELGARVYALDEDFSREGEGDGWRFFGSVAEVAPLGSDPLDNRGPQHGSSMRASEAMGSDPKGYSGVAGSITVPDLPDPGLPLDNAATALQALALAGVELNAADCRRALAAVRLPGRMQWRGQWCLDVGHNPHAAAYVASRLMARPSAGRTIALLGMLVDKDADGVIEALQPAVDAWVSVSLEGDRARTAADLAARVTARGDAVWHCADSPVAGAAWLATRLAPEDRVLVCGSFFTVAAVLAGWRASEHTDVNDSATEGAP